jgi:hypothetical protein
MLYIQQYMKRPAPRRTGSTAMRRCPAEAYRIVFCGMPNSVPVQARAPRIPAYVIRSGNAHRRIRRSTLPGVASSAANTVCRNFARRLAGAVTVKFPLEISRDRHGRSPELAAGWGRPIAAIAQSSAPRNLRSRRVTGNLEQRSSAKSFGHLFRCSPDPMLDCPITAGRAPSAS